MVLGIVPKIVSIPNNNPCGMGQLGDKPCGMGQPEDNPCGMGQLEEFMNNGEEHTVE